MEKVSLSHVKRRLRENRDFSRWENKQKHEQVLVLDAPLSKLKYSTTTVHHFLSRIDLDRSQNLKYGFKNYFLMISCSKK